MAVVMYDLVGKDDRRFSPNCWRSRMALAHKGIAAEARPTRFGEIKAIGDGVCRTIPVIEDGGRRIVDSWAIAEHLEATYPDGPSLFGGPGGRALTRFVLHWTTQTLHPGVAPLIIHDIYEHLQPEDRDYFRESREKMFKRPLAEVQAGREERVDGFRKSLGPLRATVKEQPFLGGEHPLYADYIAFGAFQWVRVVSPFPLLEADDPVRSWVDRCLDLHGGIARTTPAYD
jgi:glutathione S-transferase